MSRSNAIASPKSAAITADAADVRLKVGSPRKTKKPRFAMILAGGKK